jgi:hypothetical protein
VSQPDGTTVRFEKGKVVKDKYLLEDISDGIFELNDGQLNGRTRAIRRVGRDLYRALFPDSIGEAFEQALEKLKRNTDRSDRSLRMVIEIDPASIVSKWPLEFLYCPDQDYFLASEKTKFALSRRIIFTGEIPPLEGFATADGPSLRVLIVVSKPKDLGGVITTKVLEGISQLPLSTSTEQQSKQTAEKNIEVKVIGKLENYERISGIDYLDQKASYSKIRELVSGDSAGEIWKPHVLHFIGHGKAQERETFLGLVDEYTDNVDWCSADEMSKLFTGGWQPRLVVLQACESAMPATESGFMSMAAQLFQRKIHAIVAMQFKIDNEIATTFSREFYDALRQGNDVDEAVQAGRWKISTKFRWKDPYFGAPVLFALTPEGIMQPVTKPITTSKFSPQIPSVPVETREHRPVSQTEQARKFIKRAMDWLPGPDLEGDEVQARELMNLAAAALKDERRSEYEAVSDALDCPDPAATRRMLQNVYNRLDMMSVTPAFEPSLNQPLRKDVDKAFDDLSDKTRSIGGTSFAGGYRPSEDVEARK